MAELGCILLQAGITTARSTLNAEGILFCRIVSFLPLPGVAAVQKHSAGLGPRDKPPPRCVFIRVHWIAVRSYHLVHAMKFVVNPVVLNELPLPLKRLEVNVGVLP